MTDSQTLVPTPGSARRSIATALVKRAEHIESRIGNAWYDADDEATAAREAALLRTLAASSTWLHGPVLKDFLEAKLTAEEIGSYLLALGIEVGS